MRRVILLLISILFLYCNCSTNHLNSEKKEKITLELFNDSIVIPSNNNTICLDTLYFRMSNFSRNDYLFLFEDSRFYFNTNRFDTSGDIISPYDGINMKFIDKNNIPLKSIALMGYSEDNSVNNFFPLENIKVLNSGSTIVLKAILKFPNYIIPNESVQEIENIEKAKSVKIVYETVPYLAKIYLEENDIKLNGKFKYLKKRFTFYRPISFNCKE